MLRRERFAQHEMPQSILSLSRSLTKCSTSFNMFLEFSGFLLCRQCDPMRWSHRPELVRGLILSAWQWTAGLLDCWIVRSSFSGSQLPLLLALIWRHCHRYKTSFVCPLVKASSLASVAHISNTLGLSSSSPPSKCGRVCDSAL